MREPRRSVIELRHGLTGSGYNLRCESSRSSNFEFTFEVNWNAVFDAECTGHADSKDDVFSWGERLLVIEHLGDVIDMLTGWKLSHNLSLFRWCCGQPGCSELTPV